MIHFLLILLGLVYPPNNLKTNHINQTSITAQNNTALGEGLDTGGETQPIPPKK